MKPRTAAALAALGTLVGAAASPLGAQRSAPVAVLGASFALAQYREQAASLRFAGGGATATLDLAWRRLTLGVAGGRLTLDPADGSAGAEPFDLAQVDVRVGVRVARSVTAEVGFLNRSASPTTAAQEVGAVRVGARATYPLATATDLTVSLAYLGAARFSGGGSAPFGAELGLAVSYGLGAGRVRATAAYELQRLDRRTRVAGETLEVPIESSVARVGMAIGL